MIGGNQAGESELSLDTGACKVAFHIGQSDRDHSSLLAFIHRSSFDSRLQPPRHPFKVHCDVL